MREERGEWKGIALCPNGEGPFSLSPSPSLSQRTQTSETGERHQKCNRGDVGRGEAASPGGIAKFHRKVGFPEILDIFHAPIKWNEINHLDFFALVAPSSQEAEFSYD